MSRFALPTVVLVVALTAARTPATTCDLHVATSGRDDADGHSQATAFRTVQHAADVATAGQTVCIGPGTYRERVTVRHSGTPDRPITFRGDGATLDGGERVAGAWTATGDDTLPGAAGRVWQRDLGFTAAHLTWRGKYVVGLQSAGTDWRKAIVDGPLTDPGAQGRTPAAAYSWHHADALFRAEGRTTFVRFADGHAPRDDDDLAFCPAETATFSTGGQSWITVTGLTIQGCENAVRVPGGAHVVVRDNTLLHGRHTLEAIGCTDSLFAGNDVSLGYGQDMAASAPGHWGVWQVFRVNGDFPRVGIMVGGVGAAGNVVSDNVVHDCFDGISDWDGRDLSPGEYAANAGFTVRHNLVRRCSNDAFMAREGGRDARWAENQAIDVNMGFRLRVYDGPTYIYRNVVWTADAPTLEGGFAYLWQGFPGRVYVYNNTVSGRRGIVYGSAAHLPPGTNARDGVPRLYVWNNVFSAAVPVEFYSRDWNAGESGKASWRSNWHASPEGRQAWMDASNVVGDGRRLWPAGSPPSFVLPAGASARGVATPVTADDPASGRPWPGLDDGVRAAAARAAERGDAGAVQGTGPAPAPIVAGAPRARDGGSR